MSTIVLLGDSHTYGQSGFAICEALATARPEWRIVNAGVNGDLAWNLAERMESALSQKPDLIHILIGTNDVNAGLHPDHAAGYTRDKGLPERPTSDFYRRNLRRVLELSVSIGARVVASSIPPIGDDAESKWNLAVSEANLLLGAECRHANVALIPLHARLMAMVDKNRVRRIDRSDWGEWIVESQRLHDEAGLTWDAIADQRGLQLTHDGLHLNERAGRVWLNLLLHEFDSSDGRTVYSPRHLT